MDLQEINNIVLFFLKIDFWRKSTFECCENSADFFAVTSRGTSGVGGVVGGGWWVSEWVCVGAFVGKSPPTSGRWAVLRVVNNKALSVCLSVSPLSLSLLCVSILCLCSSLCYADTLLLWLSAMMSETSLAVGCLTFSADFLYWLSLLCIFVSVCVSESVYVRAYMCMSVLSLSCLPLLSVSADSLLNSLLTLCCVFLCILESVCGVLLKSKPLLRTVMGDRRRMNERMNELTNF